MKTGLTLTAVAMLAAVHPAAAALIQNGDFQSGNMAGWTIFTTANGTVGAGLPSVAPFDTTGSGSSLAARFQPGQLVFTGLGDEQGGGILQAITTVGGSLSLHADVAAITTCTGNCTGNLYAGKFMLLLDGSVVATATFSVLNSSNAELFPNEVRRNSLDAALTVSAGVHELRLQILRGATNGPGVVDDYVDNISGSQGSVPEPRPALLLLSGVALFARRMYASYRLQ